MNMSIINHQPMLISQNYQQQNAKVNFKGYKIIIKGAEFENDIIAKNLVKNAINNNDNINKFFSKRRGKIIVTSGTVKVPVEHEYPSCIKIVPTRSLPFDKFTLDETSYCTMIRCEYKRAFALRNMFRKPVWVETGIRNKKEVLSWDTCVNYTIRLINEKLANIIQENECRRLKVEKS